jgi:hypothetical protein
MVIPEQAQMPIAGLAAVGAAFIVYKKVNEHPAIIIGAAIAGYVGTRLFLSMAIPRLTSNTGT